MNLKKIRGEIPYIFVGIGVSVMIGTIISTEVMFKMGILFGSLLTGVSIIGAIVSSK